MSGFTDHDGKNESFKKMWEKVKRLVTSLSTFSHNIFYSIKYSFNNHSQGNIIHQSLNSDHDQLAGYIDLNPFPNDKFWTLPN